MLLPNVPLTSSAFSDCLFPRLLDQISILQQLELEAKQIAKISNTLSGWANLPRGKLLLKSNAKEAILVILSLHSLLLQKFKESETVEKHGILFWVTFGLLMLPKSEFPQITSLAMDNLIFILENVESEKMDPYFLFPLDSNNTDSCQVQHILFPYIFGDSPTLAATSLAILLKSRLKFPGNTVDSGQPGVMYTLLYTLTFIFVRLFKNDLKDPMVLPFSGHILFAFSNLLLIILVYQNIGVF